jgi:23S rRNA pseudouridine955/2504/2580 synthase
MLLKISEDDAGQRIDRFLRKYFKNLPLSMIYKKIRTEVALNGKKAKPNTFLNEGDEIYINSSEPPQKKVPKTKTNLSIIYEDENILIVDKPKNLLVHGDKNEKKRTLTNFVLNYLISKKEYNKKTSFSPAPAHRIDRNTEGLVIFAKNAKSLRALNEMFRNKNMIKKYYLAKAEKVPTEQKLVQGFISKDEKTNISTVSFSPKKDAKEFEMVLTPVDKNTIEIQLITGRAHQIRAGLSALGFPLIGDKKYGGNRARSSQELIAYKIEFVEGIENLKYLTGKTFYSNAKFKSE